MKQNCKVCGRLPDWNNPADYTEWNTEFKAGRPLWNVCPNCQTPEQSAEAEINLATIDYATDAYGRVVGKTKGT